MNPDVFISFAQPKNNKLKTTGNQASYCRVDKRQNQKIKSMKNKNLSSEIETLEDAEVFIKRIKRV